MVNAFEEEEEMLFNELEFPVNQFDQNSLFEFDETVPKIHLSQTIQQKEVQMEKTVNLWAGWSVIVGAIIGSGIFASPGPVIQYSGSTGASLIVWIIGGLLAMTGGLCYAELGTMIPESGGEHPYLMRAFGPLPAFLFSWTGILASRPGSIAIISSICSEYAVRLIFGHDVSSVILKKLFAILIVLILTAVNIRSTKFSTKLQTATTAIKLISVGGISLMGFIYYSNGGVGALDKSFFDNSSVKPGNYALALFSALWAYDGWNNLNIIAGEIKNPSENLPKAIVSSTVLVTICYCATNLAYYAVLDLDVIANTKTIAMDFGHVTLGKFGYIVIPLIVIFSTLGAANASILTGSRVTFVSAQIGHAPHIFSEIHEDTSTPVNALLFQLLFSVLLIIYGDFQALVNMYSMIAWVFYFLSVFGLCVMRVTEPFAPRPFKVWLFCPIIFCIVSASLVAFSFWEAPMEGFLALLFLASGVIVFFMKDTFSRYSFSQKLYSWTSNSTSYQDISENVELQHFNGIYK